MQNPNSQPTSRRLSIAVQGVVQGVGFRPFVYNAACAKGLSGWVLNDADMVRIQVQGSQAALDDFVELLRNNHPSQARIDDLIISEVPCENIVGEKFEICKSKSTSTPQPTIPADLATCEKCLAEIRNPLERRYRYPFTNCTNCGPRWSIIEHLPYDRSETSMSAFTMCSECEAEYYNPADRRFHAQPIACPKCGPHVELIDGAGNYISRGEDAITLAADMILEGCVVAIKGIGGFQLLVDATNRDAVTLLRQRKNRPDRPFALMMPSLDVVCSYCQVCDEEAKMLTSHRAPIVLLKKSYSPEKDRITSLAPVVENVAPGNPYLGVMLPYTPLHYLLMEAIARPIVCTSGNLSEDPMAISVEDAIARLGKIADVFLTHNRPIVRPVDDSIVRLSASGFQVMRRARGFAPLPINLKIKSPTILALGGHLKNTVALCLKSKGEKNSHVKSDSTCSPPATGYSTVIMSPHIGDLDNLLSVEVFQKAAADMVDFFDVKPDLVVCDLHPDYASTREAEALADKWDVPIVRVQHHQAHVAAAMAEHALTGPVLGLAWDGTGYGSDGTIWGGEAFSYNGGAFNRVAHLRTFALPGGDKAMHEPRRSALGLLYEILGKEAQRFASIWFNAEEAAAVMQMLDRKINCPRTSSVGRLFDAVAAICGLAKTTTFEGQAAMALEFAADQNERSAYPIHIYHEENNVLIADWEPMIRILLADLVRRVPIGTISARFHNALADLALNIAQSVKLNDTVLAGGCFQNALLTQRTYDLLQASGYTVYLHKEVPPGDGSIALGQIYAAALRSRE